jgi:hypothetical protein
VAKSTIGLHGGLDGVVARSTTGGGSMTLARCAWRWVLFFFFLVYIEGGRYNGPPIKIVIKRDDCLEVDSTTCFQKIHFCPFMYSFIIVVSWYSLTSRTTNA